MKYLLVLLALLVSTPSFAHADRYGRFYHSTTPIVRCAITPYSMYFNFSPRRHNRIHNNRHNRYDNHHVTRKRNHKHISR